MCAVDLGGREEARVEHGGVAECSGGGVAAGEETPGLCCVSTVGREEAWGEQTYSLCSTIGATMVFGAPIDS